MAKKKKTKILIVIGDVGNGHRSAAKALTEAVKKMGRKNVEMKTLDIFKLADVAPFNTSDAMWEITARNFTVEAINNFVFKLVDSQLGYPLFASYILNRLLLATEAIIDAERPDIVICIHPIVNVMMRELKLRGKPYKTVSVFSDLVFSFRGWADDQADLCFAPTPEAAKWFVERGVEPGKVIYPLFPIKSSLADVGDVDKLRRQLELTKAKPVVMITGGGVGVNSMLSAIDRLAKEGKYQVLVLAGTSELFKKELESRYKKFPDINILGWLNNIQDYYSLADVVVAKPGPATILELELFGKMAVFTKQVGEQEKLNIEYIKRNPRFRYIGFKWHRLPAALAALLDAKAPIPVAEHKRSFDESEQIMKKVLELV